MGLINTIQTKTEQARAKERIRPLLESRMMRDILLEISQRGTEKLDPQSVPLDQRPLASKRAAECGTAGLQQSVIREILLDETGIVLYAGSDEVKFLYGDYNYENIDDTDLPPRRGAVSGAAPAGVLQHHPDVLLGVQAQRPQHSRKDPPGLYQTPPRGHPLRPPAHPETKIILRHRAPCQQRMGRGFVIRLSPLSVPAGGAMPAPTPSSPSPAPPR